MPSIARSRCRVTSTVLCGIRCGRTSISLSSSLSPRRTYVDWARGLAVLLMIEAHTLDAWARTTARQGAAFRDLTVLGVFAAPLFLWLAVLGVVLSATRSRHRAGS